MTHLKLLQVGIGPLIKLLPYCRKIHWMLDNIMIVRQLAINGHEQAKQSGSKSKPTSQTYSITIFQSRNKPLQDQQALWIHHKCPSCKKQGHTKMRSPRAENGRAEGQEEQKQLTSVAYQGWRATTFCSAKVLWARNLKALSNEQIQPMSTGAQGDRRHKH